MISNLTRFVASKLPPSALRWVGRAQFNYPILAPLIRIGAAQVASGNGKIANGPAKGLQIDASLGFPGYILGTTEPEQQQFLVENLGPGDVAYEVGANVGFFALLCARLVGRSGRVYAFEPLPTCAAACRGNAASNDFDQIEVFELAVSDFDGTVAIDCSQDSTALASVKRESVSEADLVVPAKQLDGVIASDQLRPPTLLMIDVEGHEIAVFRGAMQTIAEHRPTILCEVHWLGQGFIDYYESELRPLGYALKNLEGGQVPTDNVRWHAVLNLTDACYHSTDR